MDFIGTSINYDDNSQGVNFKDDYWITRYILLKETKILIIVVLL